MTRRSSRVLPQSPSAQTQKRRTRDASPSERVRETKRQKPAPQLSKGKTRESTAAKSKYFEEPASETSEIESAPDRSPSTSTYVDSEGASSVPESDTNGEGSAGEEEYNEKRSAKKRGGQGRTSRKKKQAKSQDKRPRSSPSAKKGKELWREGVRTGLGPGKEVFIKIPKARDPGNTPYRDTTLHPNTMLFLKDLKANNERQWLKMHDADYRTSKRDWDSFVESLTEKIIERDSTIPELPAKDLVFRIYRDVRFSNDPTPYKSHFSAAWSRTGRKGPYAAYYLHLEPGHCFVGSGLWMPEASKLALLRRDVDQDPHRIKRVLTNEAIRKDIFGGIPNDEKKAVKAFVSQNQENALKTRPKGYGPDTKNIELLRLRNFTMGKKLRDSDLLSPTAADRVAGIMGKMVPFVTYLNNVVMPDPAEDNPDASDGNGEAGADSDHSEN